MKNFTLAAIMLAFTAMLPAQSAAQDRERTIIVKGPTPTRTAKSSAGKRPFVPCTFTEFESYSRNANPSLQSEIQFESWLAEKIRLGKLQKNGNDTNSIITIPVVFHVIHNGDAIGTGENLATEQLQSQLDVLNEDFRRLLGSPGYNTHPDGADLEIEFCLAARDPEGDQTTGIERINAGLESLSDFGYTEAVKEVTIWDPNQYLNIWIGRLDGELEGIGGYALFPQGGNVDGLDEDSTSTAQNDGVMLNYRSVGSAATFPGGDYYPGYDMGRVATHEIGHFLGLRHVSGDAQGTCDMTDYCDDTPQTAQNNFGCDAVDTCPESPGSDMIENYMDYTSESCKNVFTNDQKTRIQTVLQNAPRRVALTSSNACTYPLMNDGSLLIESLNLGCNTEFSPTLKLTNKATMPLTSAEIIFSIDNATQQTFTWSGSLASQQTTVITLPALTTTTGSHVFHASLGMVNDMQDQYSGNSTKALSFVKNNEGFDTASAIFTLQPDAFGSETTWSLKNSAGTTVYSGGPYSDSGNNIPALITQTWSLQSNECYTFRINDEYGDGICCTSGQGYYTIKTAAGAAIAQGSSFQQTESATFLIGATAAIMGHTLAKMTLFPNPSSDRLNIVPGTAGENPDSYHIYNTLDQLVLQSDIRYNSDLSINIDGLSNGIYLIQVRKGQEALNLKFIKE